MSAPWRPAQPFSSRKSCNYGSKCTNLLRNSCRFYHTEEERRQASASKGPKSAMSAMRSDRKKLMKDGLTNPVHIDPASLGSTLESSSAHIGITADRVLASFNKLADNKIAVPGCPPQFTPPAQGFQVNWANDIDASSQRRTFPTYTYGLEPLVRAVKCMAPTFDVLGACDVVANAGSMYRLFNFLTGSAIATARFDLEWRSDGSGSPETLLMQQWRDDPDHLISYGCGQSFADATCRFPTDLPQSVQESFTHHRVLYYELGDLRFAVHCEADGYYDPLASALQATSGMLRMPLTPPVSPKLAMVPLSSVAPVTRKMSTGSRYSVLMEEEDTGPPTLTIDYFSGRAVPVPAAHLVEIKTFDAHKYQTYGRTFRRLPPESQLYFGRVQQLYDAGHKGGWFDASESVKNVAVRLQQWETEQQDALALLLAFLRQLRTLAAASAARGHPRLSLICPKPTDGKHGTRATLYVRHDGASFLPDEL